MGTVVAAHRAVTGMVQAVRQAVAMAIAALVRGVTGTLQVLGRGAMRVLPLLHPVRMAAHVPRRAAMRLLLALQLGVIGALLMLRRALEAGLRALEWAVAGTLLALDRGIEAALLAVQRRIAEAFAVARRTAPKVAWRAWDSCVSLSESMLAVGTSGASRLRRLESPVRAQTLAIYKRYRSALPSYRVRLTRGVTAIEPALSAAGPAVAVAAPSLPTLPPRVRASSHRRPGVRILISIPKFRRVRIPSINRTLVAFAGGAAAGALVMWLTGLPPRPSRQIDERVASVPAALEPFTDDYAATIQVATTEIKTVQAIQQPRPAARSPREPSGPAAKAMTVTSTPPGARVTVDGIGWGETPITIREVPGGRKVVRVTKDGYESQQQIVSIPDDRRAIEVRITLAARN
jgi:hypothetical protein